MSVEEQILILQVEDLLIGPKMEKYLLIEKGKFRLLTWTISGKIYLKRKFQETQQNLSQVQKVECSIRWIKWDSWCSRKQVDLVNGPLSWVLDFLAKLFHSELEWSTIAGYRSSLSSFMTLLKVFQWVNTLVFAFFLKDF